MEWRHPEHPGRAVRLAYCLNVHPAEDLAGTLAGLRTITLPLRDRLAAPGERFGVGLWLPASVAAALSAPAGVDDLERLAGFLERERLDAFTFNAFPYGGFHAAGLKRRVFEPRWSDPARCRFTLDVAWIAARLARGVERAHVSISTHTGRHGAFEPGERERAFGEWISVARALATLEGAGGPRVVLALEAEPRAAAGDSAELAALLAALREAAPADARAALARHVGACLDCCHSAVEFEDPARALELATAGGAPLGKLQFSSALALRAPAAAEAGRAALLALDEPRYLHQVTGRGPAGLARAGDLPELAAALGDPPRAASWLACEEWRCHFHVPVDLAAVGGALGTTRAHAEVLLERALSAPERWGSAELHVEIETYTWDVLGAEARGAGALVDGLEREYAHVMALLARAGWRRAAAGPGANAAVGGLSARGVDTPRGPE